MDFMNQNNINCDYYGWYVRENDKIADYIVKKEKIDKIWTWTLSDNLLAVKSLEGGGWNMMKKVNNKIYFEKNCGDL